MIETAWNDGGADLKSRNRHGFMAKAIEQGPHLIWIGPTNFLGAPIFRLPAGNFQSAHLVYQEIFHGRRFLTLDKACDEPLCVKCWRKPGPAPRPAAKTTARSSKRCVNGHDLTVTRAFHESGKAYCTVCEEKRLILREARREKRTCTKGHSLAETRRVTPNGRVYCSVCEDARQAELAATLQARRDANNAQRRAATAERRALMGLPPHNWAIPPAQRPRVEGGRSMKEFCVRAHDLKITRRREGTTGRAYCSECVKARQQERLERNKGK